MLNYPMRVKHLVIPVFLILILFAFNKMFLRTFNRANSYFLSQNLYSESVMQPQQFFEKTWRVINKDYYDPTLNHQNWDRWKYRYQNKIHTEDDAKVAIDTMIASLDEQYTKFLTKEDFEDLTTSITSKIYGIGVNIYSNAGKIEIFNVIPSTPADLAGLQQGDIITEINGKDINGMNVSDVATLVRGPENSYVELLIIRNKERLIKRIQRKEIKIKNVKSSILDGHIGYIQIVSFMGETTPDEFLDAIKNTNNTDSLIIDLRGNTGGLLDNAVFIANMFIKQGEIVEIIYRNANKKVINAMPNYDTIDKPLVVLVNGASASASEILSGALKDTHKAILVGKKTFGKGLVQKVVPLPNRTGLNVTIAKYLTPNGVDINKLGIKPDIEIGNDFDFFINNSQKDVQLEKAKEILNKSVSIANSPRNN